VDKRERRRLERARLRKARARQETQAMQAAARLWRAGDLHAATERAIRERNWTAAVERAARAVVLLPRDPTIAALYVRAAEGSRLVQHRVAALEHLACVIPPTAGLWCEIAELHRRAGNGDRARAALDRASNLLGSAKADRRGIAARLADVGAWLEADTKTDDRPT
jgi:hypothetical protein